MIRMIGLFYTKINFLIVQTFFYIYTKYRLSKTDLNFSEPKDKVSESEYVHISLM